MMQKENGKVQEQPKTAHQIVITYLEDGRIGVNAPNIPKIVFYGMMKVAEEIVTEQFREGEKMVRLHTGPVPNLKVN